MTTNAALLLLHHPFCLGFSFHGSFAEKKLYIHNIYGSLQLSHFTIHDEVTRMTSFKQLSAHAHTDA